MFAPGSESLEKMRSVMRAMSGRHFHEHLHVVHDVADEILGRRKGGGGLHYAEIGTYHGCSAMFAASHPGIARVTSIDPFLIRGQEATFRSNVAACPDKAKIFHLKALSQDVDAGGLPPIDILVIDGCHKYRSVIRDFELFKGAVRPGGYVLFDDYHDSRHSPQVKPAVDRVVETLDRGEFEAVGTVVNSPGAEPGGLPGNENNTFFLRRKGG